jgi:glycosyltransferase involved in cell wall biosynthesis
VPDIGFRLMKVLQVTAALEQGGVERGTVEMAAFIVAKGAQSFVASQGGRMVSELEKGGTKHIKLPLACRNPGAIIYSALVLKRLIQQQGITLVHARSRAPAWAAYIACRMTGVKFLTTFHGTHRLQNRFKRFYNSSMVRGERVIAISHFIKQHIIDNYGVAEERIDIARRGFNPEIFSTKLISEQRRHEIQVELGLTDGLPVICLPGRLTRWKGQGLFIKALAQLKDLKWQALLVGGATKTSQYVAELKKLVNDNNMGDRVVFAGNKADIAPYYAISDIVVSASLEPEAFGRVAVEAQAMGVPVIASDHGGSLETVVNGKSGWLFTSGSHDDLAMKLRVALANADERKKIGAQAQRWVWNNFTVDKMCAAEWRSYQRVLEGK